MKVIEIGKGKNFRSCWENNGRRFTSDFKYSYNPHDTFKSFTYQGIDYEYDEDTNRYYYLSESDNLRPEMDGAMVRRRIGKARYMEIYEQLLEYLGMNEEDTEETTEETEETAETSESEEPKTETTETTETATETEPETATDPETADQGETAESDTKQYECENVVQVAHKVADLTNTRLDRQSWKGYCDEVKKDGSSWFDYTAFDSGGNEFDVSIFLGYDQQCRHYFVSVDYEKCPVPDMSGGD